MLSVNLLSVKVNSDEEYHGLSGITGSGQDHRDCGNNLKRASCGIGLQVKPEARAIEQDGPMGWGWGGTTEGEAEG